MFPVQPLSLLHTDSYDSITEMLFSDLYFYAFVDWNCGISHKESPPFFFFNVKWGIFYKHILSLTKLPGHLHNPSFTIPFNFIIIV